MKNFLKKLHIGPGPGPGSPTEQGHGQESPPRKAGFTHPGEKPLSSISNWLSSVTTRHISSSSPPPPLPTPGLSTEIPESDGHASRGEDEARTATARTEVEVLEEYQIQLALELSAKEDPEAVQIEVAKQISLGTFAPESAPAEVVTYRYWSYNSLGYDDRIMDGFYDFYGVWDVPMLANMPSLVDLQEAPFSQGVAWEVVLVNRVEDSDLVNLERKALNMALQSGNSTADYNVRVMVQKLACLVASQMGGVADDVEEISGSYQKLSQSLRESTGSMILLLGRITIGLARHRALLFKVLADMLGIPCRLVKGKQYTASHDGALNIVKLTDGREYIVDLMAGPGALVPSDGVGIVSECEGDYLTNTCYLEDVNVNEHGSFDRGVSASACCSFENNLPDGASRNVEPFCAMETVATEQVMHETSRSLGRPSTSTSGNAGSFYESKEERGYFFQKSHEKVVASAPLSRSPSWTAGVSSAAGRRSKVKDVSEYMINAAKGNPQLRQKLHDVLLESGVVAPLDLFTEISEDPIDEIVTSTSHVENNDAARKRRNEITRKPITDGGCSSMVPSQSREVNSKTVAYKGHLELLKPVEGLGINQPMHLQEGVSTSSQPEGGVLTHELQRQLMKQMPVTAAAVATAAVVASSMVAAAAKSNSDINFEVPVAAAATVTAAAVVATTAAVTKQYEHISSGNQLPIMFLGSSDGSASTQRCRDVLDERQIQREQEGCPDYCKEMIESPQENERVSEKSTGTEGSRSDVTLEDVSEIEIQWEDISLGERIGIGSFGEVYKGEWHGTEVAVKKFLHQAISNEALEEFRTEVRIMRRLRHPNVLLFMGAVTRVPHLSIVTEFLPRGSLFRILHRLNNQLDERRRLRMALDVARGMNYLHNCSPIIVHRDLKSPNLLVDRNWSVKVCDFGLSRLKHSTFLSSKSTAGTPEWMAPEVLRNEPSDERCDVFSFGVILWELCTLRQPWEGMNSMQVVGAVGFQDRRLDIPEDIDPVVAETIKQCWERDPMLRPSFGKIMKTLKPLLKNACTTQAPRTRTPAGDDDQKGAL